MSRYLVQRLLLAVGVCLVVSLLAFLLLNASGDVAAAIAGGEATPEQLAALRQELGLDRPWPIRYLEWLVNALQGDFGNSLFFHQPVVELISVRLPNTLILASLSVIVMLSMAIPLGILSALYPRTLIDRVALTIALVGQAIPNFWLGLVLIVFFSLTLGIAPASGSATLGHFVLPAITLGYYSMPPMMRLIRAGMQEALSSDYVRTARAKGMPSRRVIFKHAFRNALIPVIALLAVQFGNMLGGSVVIETVFGIQGLGYLAWESISRLDLPVVQAVLLTVAAFYVVMVLLADVVNAWLDPRIGIK